MKRFYSTYSLLALLSTLLFGCAMPAGGDRFDGKNLNGKGAQVIVYRPSQFSNTGVIFYIEADGQPIGSLRSGGFIRKTLAPGSHTLMMKIKPSMLSSAKYTAIKANVYIHPGKASYVKIQNGVSVNPLTTGLGIASAAVTGIGFFSMQVNYEFMEVSPGVAVKDLASLRSSS